MIPWKQFEYESVLWFFFIFFLYINQEIIFKKDTCKRGLSVAVYKIA